ncbi:MAG: DUF1146 family protein [Erysipelotrichaceae bacterium]|jgi:uncharacterized integral membrane protein (TIGR02327 family)
MSPIVLFIILLAFFAISLYALSSINFSKFLHPNRVIPAQILMLLLAMALSYLVVQFLLALRLN